MSQLLVLLLLFMDITWILKYMDVWIYRAITMINKTNIINTHTIKIKIIFF